MTNLSDNDIIKALECLKGCALQCRKCPYLPRFDFPLCQQKVAKDAFDLINRQKAEIERYENEHNEKFNKWLLLDERTKARYAELYEEAKGVVRAEAVKEFAERLKEKTYPFPCAIGVENAITIRAINDLVKEMTAQPDMDISQAEPNT